MSFGVATLLAHAVCSELNSSQISPRRTRISIPRKACIVEVIDGTAFVQLAEPWTNGATTIPGGAVAAFLLATATLLPFSQFVAGATGRGAPVTLTVLVALLVCLIPTTIGGLLSAIGIAGMDRRCSATCWRCRVGRWRPPAT